MKAGLESCEKAASKPIPLFNPLLFGVKEGYILIR
jgi:hypothetical protein